MKTRMIAMLLCLAMVLSMLSVAALAADTPEWITVDGIVDGEILFDKSTGTIVECKNATSANIPGKIQGVSVTTIGEHAFKESVWMSSLTIPDSVTSIGFGAFYACVNLSPQTVSVAPENQVFYMEDGILFQRDQTNGGVILHTRFDNGNTESYCVPNGVTAIGDFAFSWCDTLVSVTIPDSVTSIGNGAFGACFNLTSVNIPDSVTSIGDYAFKNDFKLCSVTIPDSVISIGKEAFYGSGLTSMTIPDSVTHIGGGAFSFCESLTEESFFVEDGNPAAYVADGVLFQKGQSKDSSILLTYLSTNDAVSYCIPNGVTAIGDSAFFGNEYLISVTIPSSVTSIGDEAFGANSSLSDVYYADSEEEWSHISIGSENTSLTNATIHFNSAEITGPADFDREKLRTEENEYGGEAAAATWVYVAVAAIVALVLIDICILVILKIRKKRTGR